MVKCHRFAIVIQWERRVGRSSFAYDNKLEIFVYFSFEYMLVRKWLWDGEGEEEEWEDKKLGGKVKLIVPLVFE